jgi:hypothetical protein
MDNQRSQYKIIILLVSAVLGIIYHILITSQRTLTGVDDLDGIIGVVIGLFICSHPAANLVDLFFYRQPTQNLYLFKRAIVLWVTLNTLVLLIGGIVIFTGTTRLIGRTS